MAQVNHRDKSYRSRHSRLQLVDPSVSLVIRSQRPDKNTNAYKEETKSLEAIWPCFSEKHMSKLTCNEKAMELS